MLFIMPKYNAFAYQIGYDGLGPVVITGNRDFKWPVLGAYNIKSCFYDHRWHNAIDIAADEDATVVAAYPGTVCEVVTNQGSAKSGYGNYVKIKHSYTLSNGNTITLYSKYNHLYSVSVKNNEDVSAGQRIGGVGQSGYAEGNHLDFQIFYGGQSIDPYSNQLLELPENILIFDDWPCGNSYYSEVRKIYNSSSQTSYSHNPIGYLDTAVGGDGKLTLTGWAFDYDETSTALAVHVYVGGPAGSSSVVWSTGDIIANKSRPDVNTAFGNGIGNDHGYSVTFDVPFTGTYPVYAYAINVGAKDNANCNTKLSNSPQTITVKSAVKTCSVPNVTFSDIIGGKQANITAGSDETINYSIKKNGTVISSGSALGAYTSTFSEEGSYEVTAYASKSGNNNSGTQTKSTNLSKVATPTIAQSITGSGIILSMQSSTSGSTIYYTTSGNTPTVSSSRYSGAVIVDTEKTIKAIAVKTGYINSDVGETTIILNLPNAPKGFKLTSAEKIAVGENVTVSWDAETAAASYTVCLYKDGKEITHTTTSGIEATLNLPTSGKYQVKIYSTNFVGNSVFSDTIVEVQAMDPLKVKFVDWDNSLIKEQEVPYGKDATLPEDPSRRGYTFLSWMNGDKITKITENLTVTANYKINTYLIQFFDASGNQVGASQKVDFGNAAISPDSQLTDIPTGYVFSGWKVIECANDSQCDYQSVDSDMKLQAVYYWENEDLPIVNEITNAIWDSETGNYTITVKLTNYPTDITTALLRVSLYTKQGKMVKSSKTEFDVLSNSTTEKTVTLKYNGTATVAKACVLGINGNDLTGSALSKEAVKNVTCISDYVWTDWSDWTETPLEANNTTEVETITQYRYADKITTTSSNSSMSGWTLYNTTETWSDWGAWSDWTENHRDASDSVQVEGRVIYRYYCFYCPVCGGREPYQGMSDCGRYTLTQANAQEYWSTVPFSDCNPQSYSYTSAKKWTTSLGDGQRWNLSTADIDHTDIGYQGDAGCPIIRYQTRYRTRNLIYTYYYYKWSDWSEWSETEVTANDNRKVETRTLYRTRDDVPVYDDLTGIEEIGTPYTISGELKFKDPDLCGKLATVMVYKGKNADPNEDQIQYISQTTIGEGNTYSFTIIAKADPTIISGDYTVCLGIEGATGLINVDMIQAPKAEYTVTYVDDDGTTISTQTVLEGENAVVPESPQKEGYRFVGWSTNTIDVRGNMTVVAMYEPIQYVVAFVDSKNSTVSCDTYYYGEEIITPNDPVAEGSIFRGWDKLLDGQTIVTENMIINAVYDTQTYTVVFADENGNAVSTQEVNHGGCAVPPSPLDVAGREFMGWSTEKNWWNVTENITVEPILVYAETTSAPSYYIMDLDDSIAVFLETDTEGAEIYYSYSEEAPSISDIKYEGDPIIIPYEVMAAEVTETPTEYIISLSTRLSAFAVSEGKNDSEVQIITYEEEKSYHINQELEITFDVNGGLELSSNKITVIENELIGVMPTPVRDGYEFLGWYTSAEGGEMVAEDSSISESCTLYAHWSKQCAHVSTEIRNAKDATIEEEGYTGDTYCVDCGELISQGQVIEKLVVDENAVTLTVTSEKVTAGKEITVSVNITKNTGIAGFSYDVNYDDTVMTLKSVSPGSLIASGGQLSTNGNVVNWYTTDNVVGDGTLLSLVFTTSSDAQAGFYPVNIALHDGKKNLVDENGTFIEANYVAGQVEITTGMLGDLNGDDDITIADVVILNRHVLGKASISDDRLMFADINGDDDITIGDVVLLNRHVLGKVNLFGAEALSVTENVYEAQPSSETVDMKIYAEDISIDAGETVDVPVILSGNTGLAGFAFTVNIPDGYTLNSVKAGDILANGTFTTDGSNCTWYTAENITSNGVLMTLNVTASETAKSGQISVGVKDGKENNLSDEMGNTVKAVFGACNVTIHAESGTECEIKGHRGGTATCISRAVCEVCGEPYDEVDATNHTGNTEIRGAKEATETKEGYTGDTYCKDCETILIKGKVIPVIEKLSVTVDSVTVKSGAQIEVPVKIFGNKGIAGFALTVTVPDGVSLDEIVKGSILTSGTFSVNGDTCTWYSSDNLAADGVLMTLKLTVEENFSGGTVTVGLKDGKENNLSDEAGQTVAANFQPGTIRVENRSECEINGHKGGTATCTEKAICAVCGETYGEVNPDNHTGETETKNKKDASCTETGYTGDVYCLLCGTEITKGSEIEKTEHSWDEGKITVDATTSSEGTKTFTCLVCKTTKTETIPKIAVATAEAGKSVKNTESNGVYSVLQDGLSVEFTKPISKKGSVNIPDYVTVDGVKCKVASISDKAFYKNTTITSVKISANVTTIGSKAFYGCKKLKSVSGGTNVVAIGTSAFSGCTSLTRISIAKTVTTIGKQAFYKCGKLTTVSGGAGVVTIGDGAFAGCSKLKKITLGSKLETIGASAFSGCSTLPKITIPGKVKKIGKQAFYKCKKLKTITIKTSLLKSSNVGSKAFTGTYANASVNVPAKKLNAYRKLLKSRGMGSKVRYKKIK